MGRRSTTAFIQVKHSCQGPRTTGAPGSGALATLSVTTEPTESSSTRTSKRREESWEKHGKKCETHHFVWENVQKTCSHDIGNPMEKRIGVLGTWLKKHGKGCFCGDIAAKNVNMGLENGGHLRRTLRTSESWRNHGSCEKLG